jgi:hypothetical protein
LPHAKALSAVPFRQKLIDFGTTITMISSLLAPDEKKNVSEISSKESEDVPKLRSIYETDRCLKSSISFLEKILF